VNRFSVSGLPHRHPYAVAFVNDELCKVYDLVVQLSCWYCGTRANMTNLMKVNKHP